jgi:rhodanese-related sulfurtransferase
MRAKTARRRGRDALFVLIVAFAGMVSIAQTCEGACDGEKIAPATALEEAGNGALLLIDVRSPLEWKMTGLPSGARSATIHNAAGMSGFLDEVLALAGGDRDKRIALICAGGVRSARAQRFLMSDGFTQVLDVDEGMLGHPDAPGWIARGLPTEPCKEC